MHWQRVESHENNGKRYGDKTFNRECIDNAWNTRESTVISKNFETLTLEGIRYAFIFILCGFIISFIVSINELTIKKFLNTYVEKYNNKKNKS